MRFGRYLYIQAASSSLFLRAHGVISSGLAAVLMDGGVETSSTYLQTFIIALLQSPESQLKAQKEIDSVVGGDRLPVLADFERLPYIKALVREVSLILTNVRLLQYVFVVLICIRLIRSSASDLSFLSACHMSLPKISHVRAIISPGTLLSL